MASIFVDIELGEIDNCDIIDEIRSRGFRVLKDETDQMEVVERLWNRGQRHDALILLERYFPELIGISKLPV